MNEKVDTQIRQIVASAYERTPAMRERMAAANLKPTDIQCATDLPKLPVLQKDQLIALQATNPPFGGMLAIPIAELPRIYLSPGPIFDPQPQPLDWESTLAPFHYVGFGGGDRVLNTFSYHITPAGLLFDEALRACGTTVIPTGPGNSELQTKMINDLEVSGFVGQPSYLMKLLEKLEERGIGPGTLPIRKALFSAEPYIPSQRSKFEEEYRIKTTSAYGTADLGLFAYTAAGVKGFCVTQSVFIEIVDPTTGLNLAAEEVGEIVVTTFNPAYPLIRFGTGDLGALAAKKDAANPEMQQITGLFGRSGDAVKVRGMFLHPNQIIAVRQQFPAISQLRAIITRPGNVDEIEIEIALQAGASDEGLVAKIQQLAQAAARLRIDRVNIVKLGQIPENSKPILDRRDWT